MLCFGRPSRQARLKYYNDHHLLIHAEIPSNTSCYMPYLSKHIIQDEPDSIIDDPSSIFFDPNEKSDFVYKATPVLTNSSTFSIEQVISYPSCPDISGILNTNHKPSPKTLLRRNIKEGSLSSEYDDSLDRTRSQQNTPTVKKSINVFEEHFEVSSRKDSLEFDPMNLDNDYHAVLNSEDDFTAPLSPSTASLKNPIGLSEAEVKKLYESSHEGSLVDDYGDLQLYEDELINSCKSSYKIKGYLSDAESTKTYQDSGIYDDDVFIESPKHLGNDDYSKLIHQRLAFGNEEGNINYNNKDNERDYIERFSAFKTPMSSRNNSLESLLSLESPTMKRPLVTAKPIKKHETSKTDTSSKTKNKYSHVQAKVECHRKKSERSPSPGETLRKKSPVAPKPPMIFGKFNKNVTRTKSNSSINSKVDSSSIPKQEPAGGERKIFNEKLNFREKAKARTDSHGIEMYSHLPAEFQEIARRLARQDSQLKRQNSTRGRSLSRSRTSSRQSSISPTRGRSRVRRSKKLTPGNSISDIFADVNLTKPLQETPVTPQRPSLSRSSSCRSIPTTPLLSRQHPSTTLRQENNSPSRGASPNQRTDRLNYKKDSQSRSSSPIERTSDISISLYLKSSSDHPSPVSKLYQFTTQNDSFGSPENALAPSFQQTTVR